MRTTGIALATLAAIAGSAAAQTSPAVSLGEITLFGSTYEVRRINVNEIVFPNPVGAGDLAMTESEGLHYLGNNRVFMSSDSADAAGAVFENIIIEAEILTDADGSATAMDFVRVVAAEDNNPSTGNGLDINPSGLTIGPVPGIGDRLFSSSGDEEAFVWDQTAGTLPAPLVAGPAGLDPNTDSEDIEYVRAVDEYFTVLQDNPLSIIRFEASFDPFVMTALNAPGDIPIGADGSQSGAGAGKGIFDVPDGATAPLDFRGRGGVVVVTLDDEGPGIEAYQYDGTPAGFETLTENGDPGGAPLPQFSITDFCRDFGDPPTLQIESGAFDPETGRLFLLNQGEDDQCAFMFVLEPVCAPDLTGPGGDGEPDGALTADDFFFYLALFAGGDPEADLTGPGGDGVPDGSLTADDFFFYLRLFSDGCP